LIGRNFSEVQADFEFLPPNILIENDRPIIEIDANGRWQRFTPEVILGMILSEIKETAEEYLGHKVTNAAFAVPPDFTDKQRQATKDASTLAGLSFSRLVTEPNAAAFAHGLDKHSDERNILVCDIGTDLFKVYILEADQGVFGLLQTATIRPFEGQAFDGIASDQLAATLTNNSILRIQLDSETLVLPHVEEPSMNLLKKILQTVEEALFQANFTKKDIHDLVFVGASSHIPMIKALIEHYFPLSASTAINPADAIAYGTTMLGSIWFDKDYNEACFMTININPISVGIQTTGGIMNKMMPRNTFIPSRKHRTFTTAVDNQTSVLIQVYEGERPMTRDNHFLGRLELDIPPMPRGVPRIEVAFEMDSNTILTVFARDLNTGKRENITILENDRIDMDMIDFVLGQAEDHHEQDIALRALIGESFPMVSIDGLGPLDTKHDGGSHRAVDVNGNPALSQKVRFLHLSYCT
jgi:endoplasmic reticulum chaperone BiP